MSKAVVKKSKKNPKKPWIGFRVICKKCRHKLVLKGRDADKYFHELAGFAGSRIYMACRNLKCNELIFLPDGWMDYWEEFPFTSDYLCTFPNRWT